MKLRRITALLLLICVLLCGCQGEKTAGSHGADPTDNSSTSSSAGPNAAAETGGPVLPEIPEPPASTAPEIKRTVTPTTTFRTNPYSGEFIYITDAFGEGYPDLSNAELGKVLIAPRFLAAMEEYPEDTYVMVTIWTSVMLPLLYGPYLENQEAWNANREEIYVEILGRFVEAGYCIELANSYYGESFTTYISLGQLKELHCGDDVCIEVCKVEPKLKPEITFPPEKWIWDRRPQA